MPSPKLPRVKVGDELTTSHVNAASEALERQRLIGGAGILVSDKPSGQTIAAVSAIRFWANFSAVGSATSGGLVPYAWKEQIPQVGGDWIDGTRSGTVAANPAYETNGNASVPIDGNTRARVYFESGSNAYFFELSLCP